jgi:phosphatidylserine/phosphatidylglycerophosphate/cardiolipin synthase-like enzyme
MTRRSPLLLGVLAVGLLGARRKPASPPPPPMQLAESWPVETTLDRSQIADAADVWLEMVNSAQRSIDLGQMYVSTAAEASAEAQGRALANAAAPDRLESVLAALEAAVKRGVAVRLLVDGKFAETYPATLLRLEAAGVQVRRWDAGATLVPPGKEKGGILHAKYFLVDAGLAGQEQVWVGSQNFDWRSLSHVQELGVRVSQAAIVASVQQVFEADWAAAGGTVVTWGQAAAGAFPVAIAYGAGTVQVTPVMSPVEYLPDPTLWDLPRIIALIDGAKTTVRVQLLTYALTSRDGTYWDEIDRALRAAAARGVEVEVLLSDWQMRSYLIPWVQSLAVVPHVAVRLVTIPEWSGGFIPYARTIHSKVVVVDGQAAWLGTSNFGEDYFHQSRNVGLIVEGAAFAAELDAWFVGTWTSSYASPIDPVRKYTAPRTK